MRRGVLPAFHRLQHIGGEVPDTVIFNGRLSCISKPLPDNRRTLKPVVNQIMQRYFFDFVGGGRSEFDYSGRELPSAEKALRLAELIALDECSHGERIGWSVSVADAKGKRYFSVPVAALPELLAA